MSIHWTREPVYASGWKGQEAEVQPNQWHALLKDRIEEATKRTYELGEPNSVPHKLEKMKSKQFVSLKESLVIDKTLTGKKPSKATLMTLS